MTAIPMGAIRPDSIVSVEFTGTTIPIMMHEGRPYVAVRPICDALTLDWSAQYRRIKRHAVMAKGVAMTATPSEGGEQTAFCLLLEYLNGWLFGVDAKRVKEEIRPTLILYQKECYRTLAQRFLGPLPAAEAQPMLPGFRPPSRRGSPTPAA